MNEMPVFRFEALLRGDNIGKSGHARTDGLKINRKNGGKKELRRFICAPWRYVTTDTGTRDRPNRLPASYGRRR